MRGNNRYDVLKGIGGQIPPPIDFGLTHDAMKTASAKGVMPSLASDASHLAGVPETNILPQDPGIYEAASYWRQQHKLYVSKLPESEKAITAELTKGEYGSPRVRAWKDFTEELKTGALSQLDTKTKVELVNAWANRAIAYDYNKMAEAAKPGADTSNWFQTPCETLMSGKGVCGDVARLKAETLIAAGVVPAQDIRLVDALTPSQDGKGTSSHEVLMVDVKGTNYVLNSNMGLPLPKAGGLESDRNSIGKNSISQYSNDFGTNMFPVQAGRLDGRVTYYDLNQMSAAVEKEQGFTNSPVAPPLPDGPHYFDGSHGTIRFDTESTITIPTTLAIRNAMAQADMLNPVTGNPAVFTPKTKAAVANRFKSMSLG